MLQLIDRRLNSRGKSLVNRARFLRRYTTQIREAVKKMIGERHLADMQTGGEVRVPKRDISEPSFGFGRGGAQRQPDRPQILQQLPHFPPAQAIAATQQSDHGGQACTKRPPRYASRQIRSGARKRSGPPAAATAVGLPHEPRRATTAA